MRLDGVTAEIRPRSDWEAVDLGFAMVRRDFWRCITLWWMALAVPTALAWTFLNTHPFWLLALFWWLKPVGSRMVLFQLSRRLFGEVPSWKSVWREIPPAFTRRFFYRFLWARLSPWLPVALAVEDLEGLRGKAYQQRRRQVARRGEGAVMWLYFIADLASVWVGLGVLALGLMLLPEGQDAPWARAVESWDSNFPTEIPLLISRTVVACVMAAMSLTDLFVTGAGFGVYINNRTWIEGWDVELAFKRLAQRLGTVAAVLALLFVLVPAARASEERAPAKVIREVKAHPDFKVHTVTEKVPIEKPRTGTWHLPFLGELATVFGISVVALLVGFVGWMIWKNRHVFMLRRSGLKVAMSAPKARVVMGMELSPDTLPADVPVAAWALWLQGRQHEALALLYRSSISRVIEVARVDIQESDTEGDCVRRVVQAGHAAHPDYFRGITGVWTRQAYAGIAPPENEVRVLCVQGPFGVGRPA